MGEVGFRKVLVANRGEIAVRIIRTLKELGINSVAIYSDADETALHVRMADEKYYVGPPEPSHSYLDIDSIVDIAVKSGVDAVHPGYGFLSQNPVFAEKLEERGIVFIGPTPEIQRLVGDKLGARRFFEPRRLERGVYHRPEIPPEKYLSKVSKRAKGRAKWEANCSNPKVRDETKWEGLVHYPFWEVVYEYGGKEYHALVDAVDGSVVYAEYPIEKDKRKLLFIGGLGFLLVPMALGAYVGYKAGLMDIAGAA